MNIFAKLNFLITFFLMLYSLNTGAQSYNFINYDIGSGLVHDKVIDITEDKFGNLWIGTSLGGISKFDGVSFENYTIRNGLVSNYVRDLLVDKKGNIWAATAMGLSKFDGKKFENYILDTLNQANNSVSAIAEDNSGIWFAAPSGGVGRLDFNSEDIKIFRLGNEAINDKVIDISVDKNGDVWVLSVVQGLFKFDGSDFKSEIKNQNFKGYLLSIFVDNNDILWLGSNKGLLKYDPKTPKVLDNFYKPLKDLFIKSATVKDSLNFWGLSAFGIFKMENGNYKTFNENEGLLIDRTNSFYCDRENNIWIGSDRGIHKLGNETFVKFSKNHGLNGNPVTSFVKKNNGELYVSTYGGGVDYFDGSKFINLNNSQGLSNAYVSCSTIDNDGNIWFGTRGSGIYKYDGFEFTNYTIDEGLVFNTVRCIFNDSENNLWIGTALGLSKYDGQNFVNYSTNNGLLDNTIWNFQEPELGKILVVTRKGFTYFSSNGLENFYNEKIFEKRLNVALEDNLGNYWIGYSGHGVTRYNIKTGEFLNINSDGELSSDLIYNLIFDDIGNLLIGSERAIDKIYLDDQNNILRIKNYGQVEGFKDLQTVSHSFYKDDKGDIYFGASDGAYKYQAINEFENKIAPITYISNIKLFYNNVDWSQYSDSLSQWFSLPKSLELPHDENSIVIEYFGNSQTNPKEVKYQFRLKGLEENWSPVTSKTEATYPNLSPGEYIFEVRAANSDGIWNSSPAKFEFKIVPPFWQEVWFFVLVVFLVLIVLKLINDYRIRANLNKVLTIEKIRSEELVKVRKRMARDFHDNMGNQLASITVFANLINLKLKDRSKEVNQLLLNIEKHTKSLFNGTKDFIWSMDPESDNLIELFTYIKDFGEELYGQMNIEFYSEMNQVPDEIIPIRSGWSRQIVLIFKEAMTNTLKHAEAKNVYLSLELIKKKFVLELKDDGKGLNLDKINNGNGFKNMRSRSAQIDCEFNIESNTLDGMTTVRLSGTTDQIDEIKKISIIRNIKDKYR